MRQDRARVMADLPSPSDYTHNHRPRAVRRITPRTTAASSIESEHPSTGGHILTVNQQPGLDTWPLCVAAEFASMGSAPPAAARTWRVVLLGASVDRPRRGVAYRDRCAMACGRFWHRRPDEISGRDEEEPPDQMEAVAGPGWEAP